MAADPLVKLRRWLAEARRAGIELAEAVALATADARGRPSVRFVLIKEIEPGGVVFYTNARSRKGRELSRNPYAAIAAYWHETGRQVRVEGRVAEVSVREADAYWKERPRDSQIASLASAQSAPLESRAALLARFRRLQRELEGRDVPRPTQWIGYRLRPALIEFWTRAEPRLHIRELYVRRGKTWARSLLQP